MTITLPPELEAQLQQAAALQGKDLATIVIEILMQVLAQEPKFLAPQPATNLSEFFRQSPLAEVAATGELDISRDRTLPIDRFIL
jgi:hypothetical protein